MGELFLAFSFTGAIPDDGFPAVLKTHSCTMIFILCSSAYECLPQGQVLSCFLYSACCVPSLCGGGVKHDNETRFFQLHFAENTDGRDTFTMSQVIKAIRSQVFFLLLKQALTKKKLQNSGPPVSFYIFICAISCCLISCRLISCHRIALFCTPGGGFLPRRTPWERRSNPCHAATFPLLDTLSLLHIQFTCALR